MDLFKQARDIVNSWVTQTGKTVTSNFQNKPIVGGLVGQSIQNVRQNFKLPNSSQPLVQITPQGRQFLSGQNLPDNKVIGGQGWQYAQNQVLRPTLQSIDSFSQPGKINKGIGVLKLAQGTFNATPAGAIFNTGFGSAAGGLRSLRTGEDLGQSVTRGITTPTSLGMEGLGIQNPWLATGVDLLAGNPKAALSAGNLLAKGISNPQVLQTLANQSGKIKLGPLAKEARGLPNDLRELARNMVWGKYSKEDVLRQFNEGLKNQNLTRRDTVQNTINLLKKNGLTPGTFYDKYAGRISKINELESKMSRATRDSAKYNTLRDEWQKVKYEGLLRNPAEMKVAQTLMNQSGKIRLGSSKISKLSEEAGKVQNIPIKGLEVRMTDLIKAEKNLKVGKGSVTPNDPVEVTFNVTTGKRELTDGYHRYLEYRGGNINNATNLEGSIPATVKYVKTIKSGGFNKEVELTSKEIATYTQATGGTSPLSPIEGALPSQAQKPVIQGVKSDRGVGGQNVLKKSLSPKELTKPILEKQLPNPKAVAGQKGALKDQSRDLGGSSGKSISQVKNPTDPYFNVNKLNISDKSKLQVKQVVEETKPTIEKFIGAKLSNKEAVNLANNSSKVLHSTVTRKETLAWEAKMLKARQQLAAQATDGRVTQEYIDNLLAIKTQGTDIARKLQSLSIGADPQVTTAKQAILEAVLKSTDDADRVLKATQGVDFNDFRQATEFYRQFIKPTREEWLDLLRYNSMLSSPNTHIINTSSNYQGTGIVAPIEKTLLGGIDFLSSKMSGKPRKYLAGEGAAYAQGYYSNLKNAAVKFSDVMRGKVMIENPDLRSIPLTTGGKGKAVENILAVPMKLLEGMDQFFTTLTKGGVESSLAYRSSKGIKVLNPEIKAQQEAAQRLFRGDFSPEGQGYVLGVLDSGASSIMALRNSENPIVRTIAKFTLPFVRTPTNILKQGIEYSPLGLSTLWGATNKTEQLTKALMGTSIAAGAATLLGSDRLSWAEPTDAKQKAAFRAAGLQPYSVKIGDKWVSYSKLHPVVAFNLAFVAALHDAQKNQKLGDGEVETALAGLSKWVNFFADQSYVKNIGDFVASTKGDLEGPVRQLSNYPQQLIPFRALMGWVNRLTDPVQRKADSTGSMLDKQLQQLMTQIPGFSQKVPARLDSKGQPIPNQNRVFNAFSPSRVTTERPEQKRDFDYFTNAKKSYSNLKQLPKDEANAIAREIKKENPNLYGFIKGLAKDEKLNITSEEMKTRDLGVQDRSRAQKVLQELNKLSTPEEKNAKVKDWKAKGIITDEVFKQLKTLLNEK